MKLAIATTTLFCFASLIAFAANREGQVVGTVTGIDEGLIVVKTSPKASTTVAITSNTRFLRLSSNASLQDLHIGDRVIVVGKLNGDRFEARTIKFMSGHTQIQRPKIDARQNLPVRH